MKIKTPSIKIPYFLGMIGGYCLDLISVLSGKKFSISSIRVQKFCATTQFDASRAHSVFNSPYTLEEGLNKTLEHEFLDSKEDDILFYSE